MDQHRRLLPAARGRAVFGPAICACILVLALAGCTNYDPVDTPDEEDPATPPTVPADTLTIESIERDGGRLAFRWRRADVDGFARYELRRGVGDTADVVVATCAGPADTQAVWEGTGDDADLAADNVFQVAAVAPQVVAVGPPARWSLAGVIGLGEGMFTGEFVRPVDGGGDCLVVGVEIDGRRDVLVRRLDEQGAAAWTTRLGGELDYDAFRAAAAAADGGVGVAFTIYHELLPGHTPHLARVAADGAVDWSVDVPGDDENPVDELRAVAPMDDGGFVLAGDGPQGDAVLVRVDGQGQVSWLRGQSAVGTQYRAGAVTGMPDGGAVMALGHTSSGGQTGLTLARTDATGYVIHTAVFEIDGAEPHVLRALPDGGLLLGGVVAGAAGDDGWLAYFDRFLTLEWDLTPDGVVTIDGLALTGDGGCVAVGTAVSAFMDGGQGQTWLARVDALGGTVWERLHDAPAIGRSVAGTWFGGWAVCGYSCDAQMRCGGELALTDDEGSMPSQDER